MCAGGAGCGAGTTAVCSGPSGPSGACVCDPTSSLGLACYGPLGTSFGVSPYVCASGTGCGTGTATTCTSTGTSTPCLCNPVTTPPAAVANCYAALQAFVAGNNTLSIPYVCTGGTGCDVYCGTSPSNTCLCDSLGSTTTPGAKCYGPLVTFATGSPIPTAAYVCASGTGCSSASTIPACTAALGGVTVPPTTAGATTTTCTCTTSTNSASPLLNCYGALAGGLIPASNSTPYVCKGISGDFRTDPDGCFSPTIPCISGDCISGTSASTCGAGCNIPIPAAPGWGGTYESCQSMCTALKKRRVLLLVALVLLLLRLKPAATCRVLAVIYKNVWLV